MSAPGHAQAMRTLQSQAMKNDAFAPRLANLISLTAETYAGPDEKVHRALVASFMDFLLLTSGSRHRGMLRKITGTIAKEGAEHDPATFVPEGRTADALESAWKTGFPGRSRWPALTNRWPILRPIRCAVRPR